MKFFLTLIFATFLINGWAQPTDYNFGKRIDIQAAQVAGSADHTDFPVLISLTDSDLRTTANGGSVEHANGFDIMFTLSDCAIALEHEIEKYDPITGEYVAWVKVPSLKATANTELHLYYGNSSISTDPSNTNVWSNDFVGVWHMNQDPSGAGPQIDESTANGFHATSAGGMTSSDLITAKIGDGLDFDGTGDVISAADNATLDMGSNDFTLSTWVYLDNTSGYKELINKKVGGSHTDGYAFRVNSNRLQMAHRAGVQNVNKSSSNPILLSANTWTYVSISFNTAADEAIMYVNGVGEAPISLFAGNSVANQEDFNIGKRANGTANSMSGRMDEVRIASVVRSEDWLRTEYNNQNAPASFYTVSAQMPAHQLCSLLPVELLAFNAILNEGQVKLDWQTATEINNDYFVIERSNDGRSWKKFDTVAGMGNSDVIQSYSAIDEQPYTGLSYYRLKQVDYDGSFTYSPLVSIKNDASNKEQVLAYPNPTSQQITIEGTNLQTKQLHLYNAIGQDVSNLIHTQEESASKITLDLSALHTGVYYLKTTDGITKIFKQ